MKAILLAGEWSSVCGIFLIVLGWSYALQNLVHCVLADFMGRY